MHPTWKKARDFEIGSRVSHNSHGSGTVFSYDAIYEDDIFIDFDVKPKGWYKLLCVTANNLKKLKG